MFETSSLRALVLREIMKSDSSLSENRTFASVRVKINELFSRVLES